MVFHNMNFMKHVENVYLLLQGSISVSCDNELVFTFFLTVCIGTS